jgi:hypothetical protein
VVGSRVAGAPILPDQCLARRAAAATEDIVVGSRVAEAPILPDQCLAHLVAAVTEAADTTAHHQGADRAEATLEADHTAAPLVADTVTTK